jgi:hypothetical protein
LFLWFLSKPMFHRCMLLLVLWYSSTISIWISCRPIYFKKKLVSLICFISKQYSVLDFWVWNFMSLNTFTIVGCNEAGCIWRIKSPYITPSPALRQK